MVNLAFLEKFDAPKAPAIQELPLDEQPGYDGGFAAGVATEKESQNALRAEVIEKLSEVSFVYAEARNDVLASLKPLFSELINKLLPNLVDDITQARLAEILEAAAKDDTKSPFKLCIHTSQVAAFENTFPEDMPLPIKVKADASLMAGEVKFSRGDQVTVLDSACLIEEIKGVLGNIVAGSEKEATHG